MAAEWENKRSAAAEVIRETRCQMLMMGNIASTHKSAKRKPYRGKSWPETKPSVPILHTHTHTALLYANLDAHTHVYTKAHKFHNDI